MRVRRVVTALAVAVLLAGCTNSADAGAGGGAASPTASQPSERTAGEVTAAIFGAAEADKPVAEADGEIKTGGGRIPARITVESVSAAPESTVLRFTLYGTGEEESVSLDAFNEFRPLMADIRDVEIGDPAAGTRYAPYLGYEAGEEADEASFCLCSTHPKTIDTDGVHLYATYPALDPSAKTATVYVPGFPDLADVPVTRDGGQQRGA
jgi:uncharacterized lipoprotein NlpE involved in copper resistance